MKKYPQQKGFVILFTILISAIILMIGLGIFSIATRETVLSGTAREAQYAFYAADSGIECALYAQSAGVLAGSGGTFECGANSAQVQGAGQFNNPYVFDILVDSTQKSCAHVTIFDVNAGAARRVISQGYNVCNDQGLPSTLNPILVERDLDVQYETGGANPLVAIPLPGGVVKVPNSPTQAPVNTQKTIIPNGQ